MGARLRQIALTGLFLLGRAAFAAAGGAPDCARLDGLREAARAKDAEAAVQLAQWYASGSCVAPDPGLALDWAHRAADAGSPAAMRLLARMYANGLGVAADANAAERWLRRAGEAAAGLPGQGLGDAPFAAQEPPPDAAADPLLADVRLGLSLLGAGPRQDFRAAIEHLEAAIARGYDGADAWAAITWAALHLGDYDRVMDAAARVPREAAEFPAADINRAHALAANGQIDNAREAYEANRQLRGDAEFRRVLAADLAQLRAAGLNRPGFRRIERLFLSAPAVPASQARP
ncbi:MAG: sel1 repeat family protein [Rhodocyclaceae bacterium]|nr:sel1 repeat family protein [Rhodocyclaceae bacterium]